MKLFSALLFSALFAFPLQALAKDCLLCSSSSSNGCQQCDAGGTDSKARSACEKAGCKVTGTGSCSTAANVKVCKADAELPTPEPVLWCENPMISNHAQ